MKYSNATPSIPKISGYKKAGILATSISVLIGIISVTGIIGRGGSTVSCAPYFASQGYSAAVQNSSFPCPSLPGQPGTAGVPAGTTLKTAVCTATAQQTDTPTCPAHFIAAGNSYTVNECDGPGQIADGWLFNGSVNVTVSNGTHVVGPDEATVRNAACVRIRHSKIIGENGCGSCHALNTGFTTFRSCTFNGVGTPCGPVYLADSEAIVGVSSGFSQNYVFFDTNQHLWRDYGHGGTQCIISDGYSEIHDSVCFADTASGGTHMDAFFQENGSAGLQPRGDTSADPGRWLTLDHSTFRCAGPSSQCTGDGCYCTHSCPTAGLSPTTGEGCVSPAIDTGVPNSFSVTNNLFLPTDASHCVYGGWQSENATDEGYSGISAQHMRWTGNVFVKGATGLCGQNSTANSPLSDYTSDSPIPSPDDGSGRRDNKWCNNKWDDGTFGTNGLPADTANCP